MFFHSPTVRRPLSEILVEARQAKGMTLDQSAVAARLPMDVVLALEEGRPSGHPCSRIHAASYARALGLDPTVLREILPRPPVLSSTGDYLKNAARPAMPHARINLELLAPLAPLGRAAVTLLLLGVLLGTWGMMRQLSRIRSIPWITTNTRPSAFLDR